jgi:hypothetical protein
VEIPLAAVAEYALLDQRGKLSVVGLIDVLGAMSFPVTQPQMFLCLRILCRQIEAGTKHKLSARLQDSDGKEVIPMLRTEFQVPKGDPSGVPLAVQVVLQMQGVVFMKPGAHSFEISIDENHRASVPIHLVLMAASRPGKRGA